MKEVMRMRKLLTILMFMLLIWNVSAQQERKYIRQGNREYDKAIIDSVTTDTARYEKAEVDYRKALNKDPNNWEASYNLGNALYKQGKIEEALHQFQAVAGMQHDNKEEVAKAYHNLGNCYLQTNKLQEAVEAYKNSLRNNPADYETKYNLAWAQNKLRQQQNQQQNQDKNQDKQNQDKDKQQQNQQDKQDQQNKDKQQQDKKDQQDQQNQQDQQQNQQQQQQQNQDKISKEDAMRILEALQNDEKKVKEKVQKQKAQPRNRTIEKDW